MSTHLKDGYAALILGAVAAILSITQADGPYTSFDSVIGVVLLLLLWGAPSLGLRDASMRVHVAVAAVVSLCVTLTLAWPLSAFKWGGDNLLAACWLVGSLVCWLIIRTVTQNDAQDEHASSP